MIAVDVLEVPVSKSNNRYLLVVQDYFTKWVEAIPMPDQTSLRISTELVKLFSMFGCPSILHSDQGRNFESTILIQTLQAFGVTKSRTTAYHPQCDGMVERFNRTLLQLLRSYVDRQDDWEKYLPLVLYAYRTSVHSSTGVSPFLLMYGRNQPQISFSSPHAFDTQSYPEHLQAKLAELRDFVESNLAAAAESQKSNYDQHSRKASFLAGDTVWLFRPTVGKLEPRWEGGWIVKSVKSSVNMEIRKGNHSKVVAYDIEFSQVFRNCKVLLHNHIHGNHLGLITSLHPFRLLHHQDDIRCVNVGHLTDTLKRISSRRAFQHM